MAPFAVNRDLSTGVTHMGLRAIGDAAAQVGISIGTLRAYEREGLLNPQRDSVGRRLYTEKDIATARRIASERAERLPPSLRNARAPA